MPLKDKHSEEELIAGCRAGKLASQEKLYKHFYSYGMGVVLRYAYSKEEAYEILNDSFLKVFDKIDKYEPTYSFKSWISRIMVNTAIDYYRKNKKHMYHQDIEAAYNESHPSESVSTLSVKDIMLLLNKLPEIYRLTFNLYEIEGYSHDEIASKMGISASTSRSNLTRAKKKLRILYQQYFEHQYEQPLR